MKKGEIWRVDLPEGRGHEQKSRRPALVLGGANGLTVAVPITTADRAGFPFTHVLEPTRENGLAETSVALVFQVRALDDERFVEKLGWIPKEQRAAIDGLLKDLLKLDG